MARISDITVKEQQEYRWMTIRRTIRFLDEFEQFTSGSFEKIGNYLNKNGIVTSDGPIVCFHNMNLDQLDVEVGFPVARYVQGNTKILSGVVRAQKVATAIDQGAYEEQDATLEELFSWIQAHGHTPTGAVYYQYLNDTNRPPREYLTKMLIPIQPKGSE